MKQNMDSIIGIGLIVGAGFAYLQQCLLIKKAQTSFGISPVAAWLNFQSSFFLVLNIWSLEWGAWIEPIFENGLDMDGVAHLIALAQIMSGLGYGFMLYTFVVGYGKKRGGMITSTLAIITIISTLTGFVTAWIWDGIHLYVRCLGIGATILTVLTWIPQIILMLWLRDPGTLSILLICLEGGGSIIAVFYQAVINREDLTTWAPTVVFILEQIVVISLWLSFTYVWPHPPHSWGQETVKEEDLVEMKPCPSQEFLVEEEFTIPSIETDSENE